MRELLGLRVLDSPNPYFGGNPNRRMPSLRHELEMYNCIFGFVELGMPYYQEGLGDA